MQEIEHRNITTGQKIYYKYSVSRGEPDGPFKVLGFFSDYRGTHVRLKRVKAGSDERSVLLADDEDFGSLLFYTN